eukprot:TRINITY_DN2724_c0_g1_i4.p2 TRINITY_DN2724_c0_g1~~TRINITY_DN2724_c0_g1_i4.p2  ORF type:complete len:112 (+),score=6.52 TRINITY_DN2724_c0_g1_i4:211-546(+)
MSLIKKILLSFAFFFRLMCCYGDSPQERSKVTRYADIVELALNAIPQMTLQMLTSYLTKGWGWLFAISFFFGLFTVTHLLIDLYFGFVKERQRKESKAVHLYFTHCEHVFS